MSIAHDFPHSTVVTVQIRNHLERCLNLQQSLSVKYHEDFEKTKGSFTPVVTDPITERVKKNMQDFSDISYRGIQRRVVEMQRRRVENEAESLT
eukprot:g38831.t1